MTSKQIKYVLGNTTSGNLNKRQNEGKYKQIDLQEHDVQIISPQFLQSKTLKKPLKQYGLQLSKTSDNFYKAQSDKTQKNGIASNFVYQPLKSMEEFNANLNRTQKMEYTLISLNQTGNIRPAYKPVQQDKTWALNGKQSAGQFLMDDKNTIFSAMLKKGSKQRKNITFADVSERPAEQRDQIQRKAGKAQNKLKKLFNKNTSKPSSFGPAVEQKRAQNKNPTATQDIAQQIQESINSYGDDQFQKYSQSSGAIKQSIREELGTSVGYVKESIRESFGNSSGGRHFKHQIIEEIQESIKGSVMASRDHIPSQYIISYRSSANKIKEEIPESLAGSRNSRQDIYEEIFEEYENSHSAFKKSTNFKESDPLSKSFRKKTNVLKSIRLAEQINHHSRIQINTNDKNTIQIGDKYHQHLLTQKKDILRKKADLTQLFKKKDLPYNIPDKNKNLMYEFKIEINKLLTGENFQSKLRKLTSFINFGQGDQKSQVNLLEDKILKNILEHINQIKKPQISSEQIQKLRSEYDQKLSVMLKDQEINLRVQMDKKLHDKDMQLKKMIAELQQKFENKAFSSAKANNLAQNQQNFHQQGSQLYETESDYSIDSDNISWKADLWQVLPQYQKRKLYEKQTKQVTNFLTQIMINELKDQSLNRDLDISFQFPDDQSLSGDKSSLFTSLSGGRKQSHEELMSKSSFNRKEFGENFTLSNPPLKKQSIFPDFSRPKPKDTYETQDINKKQNVNQYSKLEGQQATLPKKKLVLQKQKILQVLSKYKSTYIRKKNDVIRKILKILRPKQTSKVPQQNLPSIIQQITILNKEDINLDDLVYIRAYQEDLIWALASIITKNQNKKSQAIEQQLRKSYERLVILCQVKTAQNAQQVVSLNNYEEDKQFIRLKSNINLMQVKPCPLQIPMRDQAIEMIQRKEQKDIKNQLVADIMSVLMAEFARDFPKRNR